MNSDNKQQIPYASELCKEYWEFENNARDRRLQFARDNIGYFTAEIQQAREDHECEVKITLPKEFDPYLKEFHEILHAYGYSTREQRFTCGTLFVLSWEQARFGPTPPKVEKKSPGPSLIASLKGILARIKRTGKVDNDNLP